MKGEGERRGREEGREWRERGEGESGGSDGREIRVRIYHNGQKSSNL